MYRLFNIFKKRNKFLPSESLYTELTYPQYYRESQFLRISNPNRRDSSTISEFLLKNNDTLDCQITGRRIMIGPMYESNTSDRTFFEVKSFDDRYIVKIFYKCEEGKTSPLTWYFKTHCVEGILQLSLLYNDFNRYANGKVY